MLKRYRSSRVVAMLLWSSIYNVVKDYSKKDQKEIGVKCIHRGIALLSS